VISYVKITLKQARDLHYSSAWLLSCLIVPREWERESGPIDDATYMDLYIYHDCAWVRKELLDELLTK
jgi:hypothetical protein